MRVWYFHNPNNIYEKKRISSIHFGQNTRASTRFRWRRWQQCILNIGRRKKMYNFIGVFPRTPHRNWIEICLTLVGNSLATDWKIFTSHSISIFFVQRMHENPNKIWRKQFFVSISSLYHFRVLYQFFELTLRANWKRAQSTEMRTACTAIDSILRLGRVTGWARRIQVCLGDTDCNIIFFCRPVFRLGSATPSLELVFRIILYI